jgi:hypothetical protein
MKTAVEWLVEEIKFHAELRQIFKGRVSFIIGESKIDELLEQAKEMDKEQKKKCFKVGFSQGFASDIISMHKLPEEKEKLAEQYYNETFKSE